MGAGAVREARRARGDSNDNVIVSGRIKIISFARWSRVMSTRTLAEARWLGRLCASAVLAEARTRAASLGAGLSRKTGGSGGHHPFSPRITDVFVSSGGALQTTLANTCLHTRLQAG